MKWIPLFITLVSLSTVLHSESPYEHQNPNSLPPLENDENLFPRSKEIIGRIDFLYWTVGEGALNYCIKQNHIGESLGYANGKLNNASYDWNPGVRVFIGYYNAPKYWELSAEYTYIHIDGKDNAHKPKDDELYLNGTFPQVFVSSPLSAAKSNINLHYQVADILFSRVFDPNPHLRMRLLAGATAAFIDQDWIVKYFDEEGSFEKIKNNWSFNAGGLRVGVAADWWWKWCLYFSGRVTLAGYTGRYKNHARITTNATANDSLPYMDLVNKDYRYVQHLQMLLGPSWQCVGKCYHFELFLGYELNGWLNLQEIYLSEIGAPDSSFPITINTGALCLHGLTLRATLGF